MKGNNGYNPRYSSRRRHPEGKSVWQERSDEIRSFHRRNILFLLFLVLARENKTSHKTYGPRCKFKISLPILRSRNKRYACSHARTEWSTPFHFGRALLYYNGCSCEPVFAYLTLVYTLILNGNHSYLQQPIGARVNHDKSFVDRVGALAHR